ncbi:MAG: hypothetical protein WCW01_04915 [Gammaproteobacteria bacterium]
MQHLSASTTPSSYLSLTENYIKSIQVLAEKHKASVFSIGLPDGNIKYFVIPNKAFIDEYSAYAQNKSIGLMLVSLMGDLSNPLPFDKDQPYVGMWKEKPFNRNSHLWIRVSSPDAPEAPIVMYNNSLVSVKTFPYPNHLHAEKWTAPNTPQELAEFQKHPFSWMNLVNQADYVLPPEIMKSLWLVMDILKKEAAEKMRDFYDQFQPLFARLLPQNPTITQNINDPKKFIALVVNYFKSNTEQENLIKKEAFSSLLKSIPSLQEKWDEMFAFSLPQNRLATFLHLAEHDHIFDDLPATSSNLTGHLPIAPFQVLSTAEEAKSFKAANCLNIFFQLREPKFLAALEKRLTPTDFKHILELNNILFNYPEPQSWLTNLHAQRGSAYTSTELLLNNILNPNCPVILLEGKWAQQELQRCQGDLTKFRLPYGEGDFGGLPSDLNALLNNPKLRVVVTPPNIATTSALQAQSMFRSPTEAPSTAIQVPTAAQTL